MRIPNRHARAINIVRACLPLLDIQGRTKFALSNINTSGEKEGPFRVRVRAMVEGAEGITAECEGCGGDMYECWITIARATGPTGFWCEYSEGKVTAVPLEGPRSEIEYSLDSLDYVRVKESLFGASSQWRIWPCSGGYAAVRKTWLAGKPLTATLLKDLMQAIVVEELTLGDNGLSDLIHPALREFVLAEYSEG